MAERVGFEPTLEFPLNTLSKRAPSATRPSLRHRVGTGVIIQADGDEAVGSLVTRCSATAYTRGREFRECTRIEEDLAID